MSFKKIIPEMLPIASQDEVNANADLLVTGKTLTNRTPRFLDVNDLNQTVETPEGAQTRINKAITGLIKSGDNLNDFRTNGFIAVEQGLYVNQPPITIDNLNLKAGFLRITTDDKSPTQSVFQEYFVWPIGETINPVYLRGWNKTTDSWSSWVANEESGGGIIGTNAYLGDIRLFPFRKTQLPSQWYLCDGTRYEVTSDPGKALLRLTDEYKTDWGITVSGTTINVPNMFTVDGKGYFIRAINGTVRQVGSIQQGAIKNIVGVAGASVALRETTDVSAKATGAVRYGAMTFSSFAGASTFTTTSWDFDASRVVETDDEVRPLNIGMTPAIYLGESTEGGAAIGGDITVNISNTSFNTREVITSSGTFTAPISGYYKITCIGGGGSGGKGGHTSFGGQGGTQGGTTSFGSLLSAIGGNGGGGGGVSGGGGGGGAGEITISYLSLSKDQVINTTIGGGALSAITYSSTVGGTNGSGTLGGKGGITNYIGGGGAPGASNAGNATRAGTNGPYYGSTGGNGAIGILGYGSGGGGGGGAGTSPGFGSGGVATNPASNGGEATSATLSGDGGNGSAGAIILEY